MKQHESKQSTSGIFKNRNYRLFLASALIASPGFYVYTIAIEWLMVTHYESRSNLGMMLFATTISRLIFSVFGGIIADRWNRQRIVMLSQVLKVLLISSILTGYLLNSLSVLQMIIVSFMFGIADAFSVPAYSSMVVSIVRGDLLQRANSILRTAGLSSSIVGAIIGSTMIMSIGFTGVFLFSIVSAITSFILISCVRFPIQRKKENVHTTSWHDLKGASSYIRQHPSIFSYTMLGFISNFFTAGTAGIMIPILARDIINGTAYTMAALQISLGAGFIVGTISVATQKSVFYIGRVTLISFAVSVISFIMIGNSNHLILLMISCFALGSSLQWMNIPFWSYIQRTTPVHMLGKVTALNSSFVTGLTPLSTALVSYLLQLNIPFIIILRVSGLCLIIVLIVFLFFTKLRTVVAEDRVVQQENV